MNPKTLQLLNNVYKSIQSQKLLDEGDTVVVGVSGGADSACLLDILHKLNVMKHQGWNIIVAHINHGIRQETAERDEKFVEQLAKRYELPYFCKKVNIPLVAEEQKLTEEEAGRQVRYNFFNELAGENGKIATAHNKNDNAETILMHFMRGSGIKGLCGIPAKRGNIIRPILGMSRKEIEGYMAENELPFVTDETNFQTVYTRNKVRLELLPEIEEKHNPNFVNTVTQNTVILAEDNDFLEEMAQKHFKYLCLKNKFYYEINIPYLLKLHPAMQRRVVMYAMMDFINEHNVDVDIQNRLVLTILDIANTSKNGTTTICSGIAIKKQYEVLQIVLDKSEEKADQSDSMVSIQEHMNSTFEFNGQHFSVEYAESDYIYNTPECIHIPVEQATGLVMRTRIQGDMFVVTDNMRTKLTKHMITKKVPLEKRKDLPLVCVGSEVLWVAGHSATRFKTRSGAFIKITLLRKEQMSNV